MALYPPISLRLAGKRQMLCDSDDGVLTRTPRSYRDADGALSVRLF